MDTAFTTQLNELTEKVRHQLDNREANTLGRVVGEVQFYRRVVERVSHRCVQANERFFTSMDALEASLAGASDGPMSPHQQRLWFAHAESGELLRQEIETFYLFARVLLDKLTHAFCSLLGWGQHAQLSFHGFADEITKFTRAKGLPAVPDEDLTVMRQLQADIVDWRDDQIVHAISPRAIRPFGFEQSRREAYLMYTRIYPEARDKDVIGKRPSDMLGTLNDYCDRWLAYLERNVQAQET
jgi:hypothetical protein